MMLVTVRSHFILLFTRLAGVVAVCLCLVDAGCTKQQSNAERVKAAYEASGIKPTTLYPLGGRVTVDNEPATQKSRRAAIMVMAYDHSKPDQPARGQTFTTARADGTFDFGDGLPPGKYVILFAGLQFKKKGGWQGPDALKNLYNDPDVNAKRPGFLIEHEAPGKTDYSFNLNVAGETAPAQPGPKALTEIRG